MRYIWNAGDWIEYDPVEEKLRRARTPSIGPMIMRDTPAYKSPLGDGKIIEGRAARREHLKATGCREVDPSEYRPVYHTKKYAEANRGEWQPLERPKSLAAEGTSFQRREAK